MKDQNIRDGELIHHDENGEEYTLDEMGNRRIPMQTIKMITDSKFITYNTSQGHCGLCGRLDCRGECFR